MRNIHLILILLGLLTPTVAYSQFNYEFAYNKGTKVLVCEITNVIGDSLIMVQERHIGDGKSFIQYHYYDSKNDPIMVISRQLTNEGVKVFPPGTSVKYEYRLMNQRKEFNIENIHHFRIYGSISYINMRNRKVGDIFFEKTYQWE